MILLNDGAAWWAMATGRPLSITALIANGSVPAREAAALWWAIERGASYFVTAWPRLAGKTTAATALLHFLPEDAYLYVTNGPRDPITVPEDVGPVYLLINELSNHTPAYLHGRAALRAFALLDGRVRVVGTLHADSAEEALDVMQGESGLPLRDAAKVDLIVSLRAWRGQQRIERRIGMVELVRASGEAAATTTITEWDDDALNTRLTEHGLAALADWRGVAIEQVEREVDERERFLTALVMGDVLDRAEVDRAIARFRAAAANDGLDDATTQA